jgi:ADP-ribose pyrophosphatase
LKAWETISGRMLGDYRIFRLWEQVRRSPRNGRERPFYVIESVDWINIIPLTKNKEVVFINQFRHGTHEVTLEVPGGMVDAEDASPAFAARREMVEECGYDSPTIIPLGSVTPNPALFTNRLHTFLALEAEHVAAPDPGLFEDTAVELVSLTEVPELIHTGRITHALVIASFHLYDLYISKGTS